MRIAYVNIDEVNRDLAARMAAKFGAVVCELLPQDPPPDGQFDAVLYNLDDVPRNQRFALVEGLRRGNAGHPTAAHGYDISDEQAETLRRGGVAVSPRLDAELLRSLCEAAREIQKPVRPEDASTDLTWVDLAK
jgi:hypothetical protein